MRAIVFAAGRGERMRPLSDSCPKALLPIADRRIIDWQIDALARSGFRQIVVNTAHLAAQFEGAFADSTPTGSTITISREGDTASDALETLGGIVKALPHLDDGSDEPFLVLSGDIVTDFNYATLSPRAAHLVDNVLDAHFVMVPNPSFHPRGDLGLSEGVVDRQPPLFTYANIGLFAPRIFRGEKVCRMKLFPWMYSFIDRGRVSGELFEGLWFNIGTPADLAAADTFLRKSRAKNIQYR